jgi:mRNA-degrading endonuclease toxin of MazEF toxin-antitoxin module
MAVYLRGDVVRAEVRIDGRGERKLRPVVVLEQEGDGTLRVLPVTSKRPSGSPNVPLDPRDFREGGLNMHDAGYVLTASECRVHSRGGFERVGTLTEEAMEEIAAALPTTRSVKRR